jgi:hypothetical protein
MADADTCTPNLRHIPINTIDDLKLVFGHSDEFFPGASPRFGQVLATYPATVQPDTMTDQFRAALREYVYGNSTTVTAWRAALNNWVSREAIVVPVHFYGVVEVGPSATLDLGPGPAILTCDVLRVHFTGRVRARGSGPISIETGTFEEFGIQRHAVSNLP